MSGGHGGGGSGGDVDWGRCGGCNASVSLGSPIASVGALVSIRLGVWALGGALHEAVC